MVIILTLITLGIYSLVWMVKTKDEMVRDGAQIPSAWWLICPIVNLWWIYKWCGGVEHVTGGKLPQGVALLLHVMLGVIGMAIIQDALNKAIDRSLPAQLPQARIVG